MNSIHETCPLCGEYHQGTACHQSAGVPVYQGETMNENELIDKEYEDLLKNWQDICAPGSKDCFWHGFVRGKRYAQESFSAPQPEASDREITEDIETASWDFMSVIEMDASFTERRERMKILIGRRDAAIRADERRKLVSVKIGKQF